MQPRTASLALALLDLLGLCQISAGKRFMAPIQPWGNAAQDEQDAAAIRQLETIAHVEEKDGIAISTAAEVQASHARAEEDEAKANVEDSEAVRRAAVMGYDRHIKQAKTELRDSTEDEEAAEGAAALQEARALRDARALKAAGLGIHRDAVAARIEAEDEREDSKAIEVAASEALAREEGDAKVLEEAARRERGEAAAGTTPRLKDGHHPASSPASTVTVEEELADANKLRDVARQEKKRVKAELSEATEEQGDAEAISLSAAIRHRRRIEQAREELRGSPDDEHAAEEAATLQEREGIADSRSLSDAAAGLRRDATLAWEDAREMLADAAAIRGASRLAKPHGK